MQKYFFQEGGQASAGAEDFNRYVDNLLNQQEEPSYNFEDTSPEESEYIKGLREYDDEQSHVNQEQFFSQKLEEFSNLLDEKLAQVNMQQETYDWFASEDGTEAMGGLYDTQSNSGSQEKINYENQAANAQSSGGGSKNNYGNIKGPDGRFLNFNTPEEGRKALLHQLSLYQTGKTKNPVKPTSTIYEAMSVYAPKTPGTKDDPVAYANFVAKRLGVTPNTAIKDINLEQWADAVSVFEGNKNIGR